MLNSIPCPSRRTILLSLLGLILLIFTLQWLSRENLYAHLHEAEDAELIQYIGHITIDEGRRGPYEDIPKDSPLYQEVMEIFKSVTIRPLLLPAKFIYTKKGYYFRFGLCVENDGYVASGVIYNNERLDIPYRHGDKHHWEYYRIVDEGRLDEIYPLLGIPVPEQP